MAADSTYVILQDSGFLDGTDAIPLPKLATTSDLPKKLTLRVGVTDESLNILWSKVEEFVSDNRVLLHSTVGKECPVYIRTKRKSEADS